MTTQLPFLPQSLPKTQADWQRVVNVLQTWAQAIQGLEVTPTWIAPTLLNGWSNWGSGFNPAGYYLDSTGRVWVRGLLKAGTTTDGTALFVLPNPPANRVITVQLSFNGAYVPARLDVDASGNVLIFNGAGAQFVSLDQLNYSVVP